MERRVAGDEVFGLRVDVWKAAPPGNADFSPGVVLRPDDNGPSALSGFDGAHQPCGSGADNNHIGVRHSSGII
jgi:hypothetical protein